jgi:3' terminal RNA ribose 2'-O-methyltransferase Hen1
MALSRLDDGEGGAAEAGEDDAENCEARQADGGAEAQDEPVVRLNTARLEAVLRELQDSAARSVIDMGCGEGNFLRLLVKDRRFGRIAGTDVSRTALAKASERLKLGRDTDNPRVTLFQSSLTYRDSRFAGYDAAVVIEVIEHIDESRLASFASVLFDCAAPKTVVVTTPNAEYNVNYPALAAGRLRHGDHRFEWTRAQFRAWCDAVSSRYGYAARYGNIGEESEFGSPTQMAVFTK